MIFLSLTKTDLVTLSPKWVPNPFLSVSVSSGLTSPGWKVSSKQKKLQRSITSISSMTQRYSKHRVDSPIESSVLQVELGAQHQLTWNCNSEVWAVTAAGDAHVLFIKKKCFVSFHLLFLEGKNSSFVHILALKETLHTSYWLQCNERSDAWGVRAPQKNGAARCFNSQCFCK